MHFLQRLDASHELEGVMTRVVSTNVAFEALLLNQDTRSMVEQSKVGITRPAVDGALVLEYEDVLTGKRSKLSPSQCLCLGQIKIQKVRRFSNVSVPQIYSIGDLEGERVMSTGGPSIGLLRTRTSSHDVVEPTISRMDSPTRCLGIGNSPNNDDDTDVVDSRATTYWPSARALRRANRTASAVTRLEAVSTMTASRTWSRQLTLHRWAALTSSWIGVRCLKNGMSQ